MNRVGFVLPVYKEEEQIKSGIYSIRQHFDNPVIIVVADDEKSAVTAKELDVIVPYHSKKIDFGRSLCEGLCLAWFTFDCDKVVTADGDHPFDAVENFVRELDNADVIVGKEKGIWKRSRKMSNWLVRKLFLDDVSNPTCGFVVWKGDILKKIPWSKIRSNWDFVHVELLYWAKKMGAKISECEFEEVQKERRYTFSRYVRWAYDCSRLLWSKVFGG